MANDAPRFIVRSAAEADIEEAALWYELRSLGLGADFLRAVDVCFEQIRRSPESFQQVYKGARRAHPTIPVRRILQADGASVGDPRDDEVPGILDGRQSACVRAG